VLPNIEVRPKGGDDCMEVITKIAAIATPATNTDETPHSTTLMSDGLRIGLRGLS
jgi:hypothetical protein